MAVARMTRPSRMCRTERPGTRRRPGRGRRASTTPGIETTTRLSGGAGLWPRPADGGRHGRCRGRRSASEGPAGQAGACHLVPAVRTRGAAASGQSGCRRRQAPADRGASHRPRRTSRRPRRAWPQSSERVRSGHMRPPSDNRTQRRSPAAVTRRVSVTGRRSVVSTHHPVSGPRPGTFDARRGRPYAGPHSPARPVGAPCPIPCPDGPPTGPTATPFYRRPGPGRLAGRRPRGDALAAARRPCPAGRGAEDVTPRRDDLLAGPPRPVRPS